MWSNDRTMALTQKDLDLIVKALEPRFELLETRFDQLEVRVDQLEDNLTQRIDSLENDLIKSVAKELMPQVDDHERRITTLENARVVS